MALLELQALEVEAPSGGGGCSNCSKCCGGSYLSLLLC